MMSQYSYSKFLADFKRDNLVNYFIMPLTGLCKESFGFSVFINSFISLDRKNLYVLLSTDKAISNRTEIYGNPCYRSKYNSPLGVVFEFELPEEWKEDIEHVCNSKYTKCSETMIDIIESRNGTAFSMDGEIVDIRVQALRRSKFALDFIENELGIIVDNDTTEILPEFPESNYMVLV